MKYKEMSKADDYKISFEEIKNTLNKLEKIQSIKKIKMKESFYIKLKRKLEEGENITNILNNLNNLNGVKIEIDDDIEKDYEVVR